MTKVNAIMKLIQKGRKYEVLPADALDRRWGKDKAQRVTIRGIRIYGQKGGPLHIQVFTGARWVTVINIPWLVGPSETTVTARAIKDRLHRSSEARKS